MDGRHKNGPKRGLKGTGAPSPDKDRTIHEKKRGQKVSPKKGISHLAKFDLTEDEFDEALDAIEKETDRGAAIMGAALVEEALEALLRSLIANSENNAALFDDMGAPFHSLRAKIVTVYALGLCDRFVFEDMEIIRSIRNQFSHALRAISFAHADIAVLCTSFQRHGKNRSPSEQFTPRYAFEQACMASWRALTARTRRIFKAQLAANENAMAMFGGGLSGVGGLGLLGSDAIPPGLQSSPNDLLSYIDPDRRRDY